MQAQIVQAEYAHTGGGQAESCQMTKRGSTHSARCAIDHDLGDAGSPRVDISLKAHSLAATEKHLDPFRSIAFPEQQYIRDTEKFNLF